MQTYLSRTEVAARIGVKPDTLGRYKLPEPDAMIGGTRGWSAETIDAWNAARPRKRAGAGKNQSVELLRETASRLRAERNLSAAMEIEAIIDARSSKKAP